MEHLPADLARARGIEEYRARLEYIINDYHGGDKNRFYMDDIGRLHTLVNLARGQQDAIAQALQEQRERDAVLVENWAQDNKTVQPSFTKLAKAIRAADTGSRGEGA